MKKLLTVVTVIAIVIVSIIAISKLNGKNSLNENKYPLKYKDLIIEASDKYDIPPSLLCSLIYNESRFNAEAKSVAGAIGLTQITESTFDWIKWRKKDTSDIAFADVTNPEIAIDYGAFLLKQHLSEFDTIENALCAYNAGRGNLLKWLSDDKYSKDTENGRQIVDIPFKETKGYVIAVTSVMEKYQEIYNLK